MANIRKVSAKDLPEKGQLVAASEAVGKTVQYLLDYGLDHDIVITALVSYCTNLLMATEDQDARRKSVAWLRDLATTIEQQPKVN
jgi:hypothetical protein